MAKGKAVGFLKTTLLKKHVFKKNSNSDLKNQAIYYSYNKSHLTPSYSYFKSDGKKNY